jgi:AraC-like DNA-binding protein
LIGQSFHGKMLGMVSYPSRDKTPLNFWRDDALDGACLASARYGTHRFERHFHDEMVIAITEDGVGECRTRAGKDASGPGSVWVFAPGEYHCGEVPAGSHWNYRGIYLDRAGLESLGRILSDEGSNRLWVPPGLYQDPQLARLLLRAHHCLDSHSSVAERQTRWWAAMGVLFGRYGEPRPKPEQRSVSRYNLGLARDFIAGNLSYNVTIDELSAVCGLTRFHLIRSFSREYGLPPHAYANQLRLLAAKQLIAAGEKPAHAAAAVGFYDQSHLSRLFTRAYGLSPGAYRKLHRDTKSCGQRL